jgi:serine/threonine protein kinase
VWLLAVICRSGVERWHPGQLLLLWLAAAALEFALIKVFNNNFASPFTFLRDVPPYRAWQSQIQSETQFPILAGTAILDSHASDFSVVDLLLAMSKIPLAVLFACSPVGLFWISWVWFGSRRQRRQCKSAGNRISRHSDLAATEWSPATLEAHNSKNAFAPFLTPTTSLRPIQNAKFRVRRDGALITKDEVDSAFTQIRPTTLALSPGLRFKARDFDYELAVELGRGAVAQVWRCQRVVGRNEFAVKVVDPRSDLLAPSMLEDVKRRFSREAENGAALSHPNIVAHVDRGTYDGHPFLVMELADQSLGAQIEAAPLTADQARLVVSASAAGLKYLHNMGCVHRDVKPHNILRFGDRYVLGDLGIVRWDDMNPAFTSAGTITKASIQLGSWYYMAYEPRVAPHEATAASDIYALGISWYEMLTGDTPDPFVVGAKAFADPCGDPATNALIRQMVEFEQSKRPTAEDILKAISKVGRGLTC